ncbi:FAD-dependent oxidoreductase [Rubritalea profundi]|uniref:Xanthan lyase n=1 Tax=Rubritalea profundi TaxID=1658618 RepID=A0A2S7U4H0_9BACT|nr:FAD-dependent oxidoreductase [Rubritalea profundi]PQJ29073.1 xanthan lyase [Rubritalea profundi]
MNFKMINSLATAAVLLLSGGFSAHAQTSADVIVYGSTPGGFCAAIAAAREGASVILLEPTAHVGGMNTGGLSFSDSNQMYRDKLMGLFHEWHLGIQQDYTGRGVSLPYDVNVKNQTNWSYEPHVASRVTNAMLAEAGVTVLTGRYLQSVNKSGVRITSVVTSNGTYTGRVFIDGSYEGDLMAAAGVSWTIGREGKADFGESLAGKRYPKSTMNISGLDAGGDPLPLTTGTDAGPTDDGDDNIMTYSYRLSMTTNAENKVAMPAPTNYDPARFEVMRRYVQTHGAGSVGFDLYSVPGSKRDGNNSIAKQFSLGFVGGAKGWATADEAGRAAIFEGHKQYTLEFYHFLTTDSVFTQAQRDNYAQWGLCADEFTTTGNFPPQLYVRESRRMQGMYVVTENDIIANPAKTDPIMISSFPIDSHDCQRIAYPGGGVRNEGTIYPVKPAGNSRGYPYHVPYRAILPVPAECDNLLVPVALSCTHVAISSLRIEATWMLLGQSAGIAAALAADKDVTVQDLPYANLKTRLLAQGQELDLPEGFGPVEPPEPLDPNTSVLVDDPAAELVGTWGSSTNYSDYVGDGYRFAGAADTANDGSDTATFRFTAPQDGFYRVYMAYSPHETRATNVPLTVTSGTHVTEISVDQTVALPSGGNMREVGIARLIAGQETVVTISTVGTTGFVIVDALQFSLIKFAVKEVNHAADTNTLTLTWDSSPGESYRVAYSLDMTDWTNTLDSGISADTGDTTTRAFNLASAGIDTDPRVFYRVEME